MITTKVNRKTRISKRVDIKKEIQLIPVGRLTGKAHWNPDSPVLVYDSDIDGGFSASCRVLTFFRNCDNKHYRRSEANSYKRYPFYSKVTAISYSKVIFSLLTSLGLSYGQ